MPSIAAGRRGGPGGWHVGCDGFRPGSVPSALARSSPSDAGHTQAPVRSRTGPMSRSSRISDSPRLGTATGFMRPRFRPWWARCRRHPPPGPRPAPSYVPAPPTPDATPPAPPRSSTRRQAAIRSAIVTRTPCCCRRVFSKLDGLTRFPAPLLPAPPCPSVSKPSHNFSCPREVFRRILERRNCPI
jgi:hypothetical protein